MTYFYILFVLLLFFSFFLRKNKELGLFMLFLMAFMCAFRGIDVGSDTINYWNNKFTSNIGDDIESSYDVEFLFVFWTNLIRDLGMNSRWCLFSLSIVTLLFLVLSVKRYRLHFNVSYVLVAYFFFILGFYAMSFNIARQIAAATIILYAYSFLEENGKKKYLFFFFIILASSIHISSVIFLPFFFLRKLKLKWFSEHILITIIAVSGLYIAVQLYKTLMLSNLFSHLSVFSFYEKYAEQTIQTKVSVVGFVFAVAEFVVLLFFFRKLSKMGSNTLASLLFLSIAITIILSAFYGNIYRLRIGLTIVEPIALAVVLSGKSKWSGRNLILFMATSLLFGYEALSSLAGGAYEIVPYYFTF